MNFISRWASQKPNFEDAECSQNSDSQHNIYSKASKFLKKAFSSFSESVSSDNDTHSTVQINPFEINCHKKNSEYTSFENLNVSFAPLTQESIATEQCLCKNHSDQIAKVHSIQSLDEPVYKTKHSSDVQSMKNSKSLNFEFNKLCYPYCTACSSHKIDPHFMPKLQIYGNIGNWWALNASVLHMYQEYCQKNNLATATAEIVPLDKVPDNLVQELSKADETLRSQGELTEEKSRSFSDRLSSLFKPLMTDKSNSSTSYLEMYSRDISYELGSSQWEDFDLTSDSSSDDSREIDIEDDYPDEEWSVCFVCDKEFTSGDQLFAHQMKRRHFWCDECDTSFSSLMELESHKSENGHMMEDEDIDDAIRMSLYEEESVPITLASIRQFKADRERCNEEEKEKLLH